MQYDPVQDSTHNTSRNNMFQPQLYALILGAQYGATSAGQCDCQLNVSGFDISIRISNCDVSRRSDPNAKYAMPRYSCTGLTPPRIMIFCRFHWQIPPTNRPKLPQNPRAFTQTPRLRNSFFVKGINPAEQASFSTQLSWQMSL